MTILLIAVLGLCFGGFFFLAKRLRAKKFKNLGADLSSAQDLPMHAALGLLSNFPFTFQNDDFDIAKPFTAHAAGGPVFGGVLRLLDSGVSGKSVKILSRHPFIVIQNEAPLPVFIIRAKTAFFFPEIYENKINTGNKKFDKGFDCLFYDADIASEIIEPQLQNNLLENKYINIESVGDKVIFYLSDIVNFSREEVLYAVQSIYPVLTQNVSKFQGRNFNRLGIPAMQELIKSKDSVRGYVIIGAVVLIIALALLFETGILSFS
ncbi:hypothetical protein Dip510_001091 [Elusimicrobium posterum]|uniref:hypothetical protein n=1 Tax=Elusimicrobium posterum TaxID=3116653 RepID=UPI003C71F0E4